ncbi:MAG: polymer-forming cytoskeletal protein [Campylobacterota bacterium]|nr:polymer-forming cytoskeletal protein [Campylobacterota bacterium]
MAFINKSNKNDDTHSSASIITPGTKIKGEINCESDMHINGEFDGTLITNAEVVIGKTGYVTGELKAARLIVAGEFKGEYRGDFIDILPSGKVFGEINVKNIIIEPNGIFEGESKIIREDEVLKLESKKQPDGAKK